MARLKDKYNKEVIVMLQEKFQFKSIMQVPRITKICINRGIGAAVADKKLVTMVLRNYRLLRDKKQFQL